MTTDRAQVSTDRDSNGLRPYPGLRPFVYDEHGLFYGRDDQIREIVELLSKRRFIAVLGGSGSGKSSLVRAGVIPELRNKGIPEAGDCWLWTAFLPGPKPMERLVEAWEALLEARTGVEA